MKPKKTDRLIRAMQLLPLIAIVVAVLFLLPRISALTVEDIVNYTPDNFWLAAGVFLLIYLVKPFFLLLPVLLIYVSSGFVFGTAWAIVVNLVGLLLCLTSGYFFGRVSGKEFVGRLVSKYKQFEKFQALQENYPTFFPFLSRAVGVLPLDVVSMYFGSSGTSFWRFLTGSILGLAPQMILATFAGTAITEPGSPEFLLSVGGTVLLITVSMIVFSIMTKQSGKKNSDNRDNGISSGSAKS